MAWHASFVFVLLLGLFTWARDGRVAAAQVASDGFDYTCFPGISPSAGVMIPRGDIFAEVNSKPFPIYCMLNPDHKYYKTGFRSDKLVMYVAVPNEGLRKLESIVINATTIKTIYEPSTVSVDQISCKIDLPDSEVRGICHQNMFIGRKPLPPKDFRCISENWESLNCTWNEEPNPVKTTYTLTYMEPGSYGRHSHCPVNLPNGMPMPDRMCYIDKTTEPMWRPSIGLFKFLMHMENPLSPNGTFVPFPVNSSAVVRPSAPVNLTTWASEPRAVSVFFQRHHALEDFTPGLVTQLEYRSEFDPVDFWRVLDTTDVDTRSLSYNFKLAGLLPYAEYTIRVNFLSAAANASNPEMWSEASVSSVRTLAALPDRPPRTARGSFEIVGALQQRLIYVYWQHVPDFLRNGPDFEYIVTEVNEAGSNSSVLPVKVTDAYAEFPNLSLRNYTFFMTSQNKMGRAPGTSKVFVGHLDELRGLQPRSFTKIAYSETVFEVSWLPPVSDEAVTDYTVFWCKAKNGRDRPYQCDGYLDWLDVGRDIRSINVTLPSADVHQFAIAANTKRVSSGMVWATCTILHNKVVGKMKTVAVDVVEPLAIKIRWRLDCSDRVGIVTGYRVAYCPIESENDTAECINGKELSIMSGPDKEHVWVTGLQPWTSYKIGVAVVTRAGESELSDYQVNRTGIARPGSPPLDLEAVPVNTTSADVFWRPPAIPNGPIAYYEVRFGHLNFRSEPVDSAITRISGTTTKIGPLLPHTQYEVRVRACTQQSDTVEALCGREWGTASFTTGIGESGRMEPPQVTFRNSTEVDVSWGHDFHKGGPIRDFELQVTHQGLRSSRVLLVNGDVYNKTLSLAQIGRDESWSPDCVNGSVTNLYNFSIRAVTFEPSTRQTFKSQWSPIEVAPAFCEGSIPWGLILPVVITIPIVLVVLTLYLCKCYKDVEKWKKNLAIAIKGNAADLPFEAERKPVKPSQYNRAHSKESTQVLLPLDTRRNASGSSNQSTSGSETSARTSEMDDHDVTHTRSSSESVDEDAASAQSSPNNYSRRMSPTISDLGEAQSDSASVEAETGDCPAQTPQILGSYSRVGLLKEDSNPCLLPLPGQTQKAALTSGYVALQSVQTNPAPSTGGGYITVAEANKMSVPDPSCPNSAEFDQQQAQMDAVYSKVGLNQSLPSARSQSQLLGSTDAYDLMSPSSVFDHQALQVEDSFLPPPCKLGPELGLRDECYVQVHSPDGDEDASAQLLVTPKTLHVESKSPFNRTFTSLSSAKSTMV